MVIVQGGGGSGGRGGGRGGGRERREEGELPAAACDTERVRLHLPSQGLGDDLMPETHAHQPTLLVVERSEGGWKAQKEGGGIVGRLV